jgi:hypothetical protein
MVMTVRRARRSLMSPGALRHDRAALAGSRAQPLV